MATPHGLVRRAARLVVSVLETVFVAASYSSGDDAVDVATATTSSSTTAPDDNRAAPETSDVLEAAGTALNYATFDLAIEGLAVAGPGDPTPRTYGVGSAGDSDPAAYLFGWDSGVQDVVLEESL